MNDIVLVKDLPCALKEAVVQDLTQYTVAFLRLKSASDGDLADLLGSGVLVSVGTKRAILTAHHVVEELPKAGRFGLFLDRTREPHTIDIQGVAVVKIGRGTDDAVGPDLAAVLLAPQVAGAIGVKKTFYNLHSRRHQLLNNPPDLRDGVWCAQGFLDERTVVAPDSGGLGATKYFYNFSGFGGPETSPQIGGHDYFDFPVSHEGRASSPASWGGMSGAGLWQVPLKRQLDVLVHLAPLLSGILFYQWPTTETECGVRGHGRRSLYEVAYNCISNGKP